MTDRDTFAAAALTGLLSGPGGKTVEEWALHAYSLADAMLRERTTNKAAPAAGGSGIPARPEALRCCEATHENVSASATGKSQEPVAWAVCDATWYHDVRLSQWTAEGYAAHLNAASGKRVYTTVPLYRQPQPTLTAEERDAIAWAAEMIPAMAHPSSASAHIHAATFRALLERLK